MPKFAKIIINPLKGQISNIIYIPDIIKLVERYKHKLFDDYFFQSIGSVPEALIDLIERTSPYFWAITDNKGRFSGFVYLDDWQGSQERKHSATITTCILPCYRGKFTVSAGKKLIKYVFRKYKLIKLKAEVYSNNKNAVYLLKKLGFDKECTLKAETLVGDKPTDIDIYSIIKTKEGNYDR